jgi:hypothetical protein
MSTPRPSTAAQSSSTSRRGSAPARGGSEGRAVASDIPVSPFGGAGLQPRACRWRMGLLGIDSTKTACACGQGEHVRGGREARPARWPRGGGR